MRMKRLLSRKMHELTRLQEELHLTTTTKWESLLFTLDKTTERWEYGNSLNKISEVDGTTNHCGLEGYRENLKSYFTPPGIKRWDSLLIETYHHNEVSTKLEDWKHFSRYYYKLFLLIVPQQ